MTFDLNQALTGGWDRITTATGAQLVAIFVAVAVLQTIVTNSIKRIVYVDSGLMEEVIRELPPNVAAQFQNNFQNIGADFLTLPLGALAAISVALIIIQLLLQIGAIRWFVEQAPTGGLSAGLFTRRILWTVGNLIVGGILYIVTVTIGFVFLIAPGVYLAVALFFYNYEIVVQGENALEALSNSWEMTSDNRLLLFLLGLLFFVLSTVLGFVTGPLTIPNPTARVLVNTAITTTVSVFGIAVASAAYTQLSGVGYDAEAETEDFGAARPDEL